MIQRRFWRGSELAGWIARHDAIKGMKQIKPGSVDLIFADPPFGLPKMAGGKIEKAYNRKKENILDGYVEVAPEDYHRFTWGWVSAAVKVLRPGGAMWVMSGWTHAHVVHHCLLSAGLEIVNKVIWKYNFGVWTTRKCITSHYEMFYVCKPPDSRRTFNRLYGNDPKQYDKSMRTVDYKWREDVWVIPREYHPGRIKNITKLPGALVHRVIIMTTNRGDLVLDPFVGNGTTLVHGFELDRKVIGFELNKEAYIHASEEARRVLQDRGF